MTESAMEAIKKSYLDGAMDAMKTSVLIGENIYEMSLDNLPPVGHCDPWGKILAFSPKLGWRCIRWDDAHLHVVGDSPCTNYTFTPEAPPVKKAQ